MHTLPWGIQARLLGVSLVFPSLHPVIFISFIVFLEAPLRLLWALLGTFTCRVLGVLRSAFSVHSWRSLVRLPEYLLLGAIFFSGRSQWPHKPLDPGILI